MGKSGRERSYQVFCNVHGSVRDEAGELGGFGSEIDKFKTSIVSICKAQEQREKQNQGHVRDGRNRIYHRHYIRNPTYDNQHNNDVTLDHSDITKEQRCAFKIAKVPVNNSKNYPTASSTKNLYSLRKCSYSYK